MCYISFIYDTLPLIKKKKKLSPTIISHVDLACAGLCKKEKGKGKID